MTDPDMRNEAAPGLTGDEGQEGSLLDWQSRLNASDGYRAWALMEQVKRIAYVLQGNVGQYLSFVAGLQDPAVSLPILDLRTPDAHDDMLSEAERLLHNVLVALSTRVDQQRRLMETHFADDVELTTEYAARITSDFADPLAAFMKNLRNYLAHRSLPVAQSLQTLGIDTFAITFTLPCEPLLKWERWSAQAKAFLTDCGEAVRIVDAVNSYARKASAMDKWLYDRIGLKYAIEIETFQAEQELFNRRMSQVYGF